MTRKIVFATNNHHKLDEVKNVLKGRVEVVSLSEIGCYDDIPENAETLEGNAELKARYVGEKFNIDCFADDTGLEIEALDGKPGVYSARYAGEPSDSAKNVSKILSEMEGKKNRKARFKTVLSLYESGKIKNFEGIINGIIAENPTGSNGFGYDPVFVPEGYKNTFAELSSEEKNKISHRAIAVKKLSDYFSIN